MFEYKLLTQALYQESFLRGNFILTSGKVSSFYLDVKKASLNAGSLDLITEEIYSKLPSHIDTIGGMTIGADPIIGAVLKHSFNRFRSLKGFLVRKENKSHGIAGRIVGNLNPGNNIYLIEDVVTTGKSTLELIDVVSKYSSLIKGIISVVDRNEGGREILNKLGKDISYRYLVGIEDILDYEKYEKGRNK